MADYNVGEISYTLDAKTEALIQANKKAQRSLDDVDNSLDKTSKSSRKFDAQLKKTAAGVKLATNVMKKGAVAATALATALTVVASKAAGAAREIELMSKLSGVGVERFQELAFGAKSVGISTEKLGDILKDVQDKVGDFLNTGGGELKDYFENIAPLVGQTAEEFRGLSGPDALIKFKQGLDAANLSASEQIFYLESLANDASLLSPLLKDNAKGFDEAAKRANELNAVLSETEISELTALKSEFDALFTVVGTVTQKIVADFAPSLIAALKTIAKFISSTGAAIQGFFDQFRDTSSIKSVDSLNKRLDELRERRADLMEKTSRSNALVTQLREVNEEIYEVEKRLRDLGQARKDASGSLVIEINRGAGQQSDELTIDPNGPMPNIFDTEAGAFGTEGPENSAMNQALQEGLGISQQMADQIETLDQKFQNLGMTIADSLVDGAYQFADSMGTAMANAILWGDDLEDSFKAIGRAILTEAVGSLITLGIQYGINAALKSSADATMAASGTAAIATNTVAGVASANTLSAAYAPAAAGASVATAGGAAVAGTAALSSTYATANALSIAGGRLNGGPVGAGKAYEVTEDGKPEMLTVGGKNILMMGNQSGTVTSNKDMNALSGGINVVNNVYNETSSNVETSASLDGNTLTIETFVRDMQSNGPMARSITSNTSANYKSR